MYQQGLTHFLHHIQCLSKKEEKAETVAHSDFFPFSYIKFFLLKDFFKLTDIILYISIHYGGAKTH